MLFKTPNLQSVGGPFIKLSTPKRMLYVFNIFCHLSKKLYIYKRNSFSFCLFFSSSFLPKVIHFRVEILFYARLSQCWIFSPSRESKDHIDYLIIGAYPLRPQDWPHNHHCAALVKQNHIVDVFSYMSVGSKERIL